jgi:hypothetical protein
MLDLRRSAQLDANLVKRLVSACDAFSNGQIDAMLRAGIRVWPMVGSPSPYNGWQMPTPAARAAYTDHARVVLVRDNARTSDLRHELAHAWDHVKADKLRGRLDAMPREKRDRLMKSPPPYWSENARESVTPQGARKPTQMTVQQMRDAYRKRLLSKEEAFDNPDTREGYSRGSVQEFYAEGYSVYHGHCEACQARMLAFAPELFEALEREAKKHGHRRLDRQALAAALTP